MRSRFLALLLLLTLGLTLGAGVHPCGAVELAEPAEVAHAVEHAPAAPSCHTQAAPARHGHDGHEAHAAPAASPAEQDAGGCGEPGSSHPCPHFCHTTGLLAVTPPVLTVQAVEQLLVAHIERPSSAPSRSIDHVPLA